MFYCITQCVLEKINLRRSVFLDHKNEKSIISHAHTHTQVHLRSNDHAVCSGIYALASQEIWYLRRFDVFSNSCGFFRDSTHLGSLGFVRFVLQGTKCTRERERESRLKLRSILLPFTSFFLSSSSLFVQPKNTHSLTTDILETNSEIIYVKCIVMWV